MRHNTTLSIIFVRRFTKGNGYGYVNTHANIYIGKTCDAVFLCTDGEQLMNERTIERKLVEAVRSMGGLCPKFTSPGWDGVPDRIVLLPDGKVSFVETKAPGKRMRPLQRRRKEQLEGLGFKVFCLDSVEGIKEVLDEIRST